MHLSRLQEKIRISREQIREKIRINREQLREKIRINREQIREKIRISREQDPEIPENRTATKLCRPVIPLIQEELPE